VFIGLHLWQILLRVLRAFAVNEFYNDRTLACAATGDGSMGEDGIVYRRMAAATGMVGMSFTKGFLCVELARQDWSY
jgi:hypothetical protein